MKNRIQNIEKVRRAGKNINYAGYALFALGALVFIVAGKDMTTVAAILLVAAYFAVLWGGSVWLFGHCYKGFLEKDIMVIGDEIAPVTRYRGKSAKVWGIIGMALSIFIFAKSILPIFFLLNSKATLTS